MFIFFLIMFSPIFFRNHSPCILFSNVLIDFHLNNTDGVPIQKNICKRLSLSIKLGVNMCSSKYLNCYTLGHLNHKINVKPSTFSFWKIVSTTHSSWTMSTMSMSLTYKVYVTIALPLIGTFSKPHFYINLKILFLGLFPNFLGLFLTHFLFQKLSYICIGFWYPCPKGDAKWNPIPLAFMLRYQFTFC